MGPVTAPRLDLPVHPRRSPRAAATTAARTTVTTPVTAPKSSNPTTRMVARDPAPSPPVSATSAARPDITLVTAVRVETTRGSPRPVVLPVPASSAVRRVTLPVTAPPVAQVAVAQTRGPATDAAKRDILSPTAPKRNE